MRAVVTWANVYLVCFLLGFSLSAVSWVIGVLGVHVHLHPVEGHPHVHHHGFDHAASAGPSVFNFSTAMAFLAWFGGAGYLLTHYAEIWPLAGLAIASSVGFVGAALVFWLMSHVLWSRHENMNPDDYDVVGLIGTVTSSIRAGGTGEVLFQQAGAHRVVGARSEDGVAIGRNSEVVITRYENGLAYVRTWEELTADSRQTTDTAGGRR